MRFPVCLKHVPHPGKQALSSICFLARAAGVGAHQMCAAYGTRRHATAGKTVELRATSPDKDAIVRARLLDDLLNNRKKIERLRSHYKGTDEKTHRRQGRCTDNAGSDPSPAWLRRTSVFRYKTRERLAGENRQRQKNRQMIMSRKSPSNKDRQITEDQPQNKQHLLGGRFLPVPKRSERLDHLPNTKIP